MKIKLFTLGCALLALIGCRRQETLRVLQFNIWQEGTQVPGGYDAIVQQIIDSRADVVTLSEVRNYDSTRFGERIVRSLKEQGQTFYSFYSYDTGILSRYPITDSLMVFPENGDHGSICRAVIEVNGRQMALYSAHLDYLNCAYYMVKGYDGNTWEKYRAPVTDVDTILQVNTASQRDDAIREFLRAAALDREQGRMVILAGDFNEPSHLDWTERTAGMFDRRGLVVPWTVSGLLSGAGFIDSYREKYPDPATHPGITYPADIDQMPVEKLTWAPGSDERERIDFILYAPSPGLQLDDVSIWGPSRSICRSRRVEEGTADPFAVGQGIWPSDHKAVLATFTVMSRNAATGKGTSQK